MALYDANVRSSESLLRLADRARLMGREELVRKLEARAKENAKIAAGYLRSARTPATKAYNIARSNFWDDVHKQPELVKMFEDMGLKFRVDKKTGKKTGAPFLEIPGGRNQTITIEHDVRRSDDPRRAVDFPT